MYGSNFCSVTVNVSVGPERLPGHPLDDLAEEGVAGVAVLVLVARGEFELALANRQVEDVGTAPAARRQGLARAVVAAAVAASHAAGHELTFLNCDADGWVAGFYAGLGFEPVGLVYNFHRV